MRITPYLFSITNFALNISLVLSTIYLKVLSIHLLGGQVPHSLSLIVYKFLSQNLHFFSVILNIYGIYWFDGVVGIGISILICISGIKIFIESYNVLMDSSIDNSTKQEILEIIKKYDDIKKVDHFSSTPVGYKYLISVSIYIDGNMSTYDSHEIADKLEKELNSLEPVYLSIIHVNPI